MGGAPATGEEAQRPRSMTVSAPARPGEEMEACEELALALSRGLQLDTQRSSRDSLQCSSGYSTQTTTPCCSEDTIPSQAATRRQISRNLTNPPLFRETVTSASPTDGCSKPSARPQRLASLPPLDLLWSPQGLQPFDGPLPPSLLSAGGPSEVVPSPSRRLWSLSRPQLSQTSLGYCQPLQMGQRTGLSTAPSHPLWVRAPRVSPACPPQCGVAKPPSTLLFQARSQVSPRSTDRRF